MPKRGKKTPGLPVKGTTSSVKRGNSKKKDKAADLNGSFLQSPEPTGTVSSVEYTTPAVYNSKTPDNSDAILAYLKKLDESNQVLLKRVSDLEANKSLPSTPSPRAHSHTGQPLVMPPPVGQNQLSSTRVTIPSAASMDTQNTTVHPNLTGHIHTTQTVGGTASVNHQPLHYDSDGILPSISALRQNPTISQSVAQVMASYEAQAKQEASLGKQIPTKKSGCFNATDAITSGPELRWPNEGYQGVSAKKRILYDELSLPEWAVGQLTNIYHIQDPAIVKKALLQTILALKDATSLPWQAVRSAYANSMHDMEQGTLTWDDQMQWSLNRLSASQIAMANANIVSTQGTHRKICKYFNEGTCTFDSNHGNFKHVCSFCARSGKNFVHPELKCHSKQRGLDRQVNK